MTGLVFQLVASVVILVAAVLQLPMVSGREQLDERQRRRRFLLVGLLILGGVGNGIAAVLTHLEDAKQREQAQLERKEISDLIQVLAGQSGLTDSQVLVEAAQELRMLRVDVAGMEEELEGLTRYSQVAEYDIFGLRGLAGPGSGLRENSPIADALEGAWQERETENGPKYFARCDEQSLKQFEHVTDIYPDFPFTYYALAVCLAQEGNARWRDHAERAVEIFQHTTQIAGHRAQHHEAQQELLRLLETQD